MRISPKPLEIDLADPFKNDIFNRKFLAEALRDLIKDTEDENVVISINAKWGEGKTTFAKMWKQFLKNDGYPVIYFDAFENDHIENAFISIIRVILDFFEQSKGSTKKLISKLKKSTTRVAKVLIPAFSKIAISAATVGIINERVQDDISKNLGKIVSDESEKVLERYLTEKLSSYEKDRKALCSFKDELQRGSQEISGSGKRLVIILDELDRCKPTFAVDVLESVKHLFSVPGVVFVLIMNDEQMHESIKSVYGQGIDAKTYLQKFLTLEVDFPKNNQVSGSFGINDTAEYCRLLRNQYGFNNKGFMPYIEAISHKTNLSLRDIEKIFSQLIWFRSDYFQDSKRTPIVAFLAFMKVKHHKEFIKLSRGELSWDNLIKSIEGVLPNFDDVLVKIRNHDDRFMFIIEAMIKGCLYSNTQIEALSAQKQIGIVVQYMIQSDDMDRAEIIPDICRRMNLQK